MENDDAAARARQRELVRRGYVLRWLEAARLAPIWHRYIPEGDSGHSLILSRALAEPPGGGRSGRGPDRN